MCTRKLFAADDSYQISYEHSRQFEQASHFRPSTEVSPFISSGKHQEPDGENECFDSRSVFEASFLTGDCHACSVPEDVEFRMSDDMFNANTTSSAFNRVFKSSSFASETSSRFEVDDNGKRASNHFWDEGVNKRAKQEIQAVKLEHLTGNTFVYIPLEENHSEWRRTVMASAGVNNSEDAGYESDRQIAVSDQSDDTHFQFSEHSHWRHVPVGPNHQADLPEWTALNHDKAVDNDKQLGICILPMPQKDFRLTGFQSCTEVSCDCIDEGSIGCFRKHVMAARDNLSRALGREKFNLMGFSEMGEIVAQRWTEEEENLFHEVVLSNPASLGRGFWAVLRRAFPSRRFKELVSYYFNVFVLRLRAHQNRLDLLGADSDNDEWQESSDTDFAVSDEGEDDEDDDSAVESPSEDGNHRDAEYGPHCGGHLIGTDEDDEGQKGLRDGNSSDCVEDQDIQDDSCTSYELVNGYNGHIESSQWKVSCVGAIKREIDFFPICDADVIEEEADKKASSDDDGCRFSSFY